MFKAGWDKQEILIEPNGLAMFGYGQRSHRAKEKRTALFARSICIKENEQDWLIFCCADLGCITSAIRLAVIHELAILLKTHFNENRLVLTATHTHSGPGGCAFEVLYNLPTKGFVSEHVGAIVNAIVKSVMLAISGAENTEIAMTTAQFDDEVEVAWNRSISAYNLNTGVIPVSEDQSHLALDREMQVLGFYRNQKLQALLSLFGVHATCLGNHLHAHDGDNKGYAAIDVEERLTKQGIISPVAIFAQASAGDVSPYYHGRDQLKKRKKIKGEKEYLYAKQNGLRQSQLALQSLQNSKKMLKGQVDGLTCYVNFSHILVDSEFSGGYTQAYTSPPCWGTTFFAGTPVDGIGVTKSTVITMGLMADYVRKKRIKNNNPKHIALYQSQGRKKIVIESKPKLMLGKNLGCLPDYIDPLIGEMNHQIRQGAVEESLLAPEILPLQLIRIAHLVLVCCPGEITTIAAKRLKNTVKKALNDQQAQVWLVSYCNDYMGYITTYEEYQKQNYEGAHTLYGQWTLAAFQTQFKQLAQQFYQDRTAQNSLTQLKPKQPPVEELAKRSYVITR